MKFLVIMALVMTQNLMAETFNPKYFANEAVQRLAPEAFALRPEAAAFHSVSGKISLKERQALIKLINENPELKAEIVNFKNLDWEKKEKVLKTVFALEVKALKIQAPILIIDSKRIKGEAYFDFDIHNPTPGTVIINPEAIAKDSNPYTALLLLVHETRHSAQFQLAFMSDNSDNPMAKSYKAAFIAQKEHATEIVSFCDFLTLINEYEAFQFGNYVISSLVSGDVDTLGMGTYASQFNQDFTLKIDLGKLFKDYEGGENKETILNTFNGLEKAQYDILIK
ncbi:hypothetical protein SHI21_17040 [Bacteriovorax sp. PP10]|uniref:DUF2268 domain-containing protein n=1 Tax=Bacteriovorax antarcticus TaxID=3088717 RepID=A0ABU5VXZ4_9BACT|nr:hypothetical protein [Bacteriovorax sp. PP10]MEA9357940.1 hypothetical protein [Bacteriovorax sp. PP10]